MQLDTQSLPIRLHSAPNRELAKQLHYLRSSHSKSPHERHFYPIGACMQPPSYDHELSVAVYSKLPCKGIPAGL